mmetsp:Transcript_5033/g.9005  ORF Transcript_5033/g.9005 Transcript_5033/m.9005 type:complete len:346 (+) Transcript_5033:52-1089(+)
MGNQECSVKQMPGCFKDESIKGFNSWDKSGPEPYQTAEQDGFNSRDYLAADKERGLFVETDVRSRSNLLVQEPDLPPEPTAKAPDFIEAKSSQAAVEDSLDSPTRKLLPTYFDREIGEAPILEDSSIKTRARHQFRSGAVYDGEWLGGMRHGVGKQTWPDKTEYIGEWLRGRANGKGRIKHSDGDVFIGEWVNGRAHGCGVYRFQDGAADYAGQFSCDFREGLGVETWVDGSSYAGTFRNGEKSGYASNIWPDGTMYHGHWRANALSGSGKYSVPDSTTFCGQWEKSMPHGMGQYEWPNGQKYCGKYRFDKKDGFGILYQADGSKHQGYWVRGEPQRGGGRTDDG